MNQNIISKKKHCYKNKTELTESTLKLGEKLKSSVVRKIHSRKNFDCHFYVYSNVVLQEGFETLEPDQPWVVMRTHYDIAWQLDNCSFLLHHHSDQDLVLKSCPSLSSVFLPLQLQWREFGLFAHEKVFTNL